MRSAVRDFVSGDTGVDYAGYVAWRGLADEGQLPAVEWPGLFDKFCFYYTSSQLVLTYPVAGPQNSLMRGQRRLNIVWYRPAAQSGELVTLMTDTNGVFHAHGIPPGSIKPEVVAKARHEAQSLPSPFREAAFSSDPLFLQPVLMSQFPQG